MGGMILIYPSATQTPSKAIWGMAIVYFTHVTSLNLLVFTLISFSLGLEGRSLISFGTWIVGPFICYGLSFRSRCSCDGGSAG